MRFNRYGMAIPIVALVLCTAGISRADTVADLEATVGYPLTAELTIQISTQNGVLKHVVHTGNGEYVVYKRTVANTIPWSVAADADESYSYYKVLPGEEETPNGMTCCYFSCGARTLSWNANGSDCALIPGNQCAACTMTCTTGNPTCQHQRPWLEVIN